MADLTAVKTFFEQACDLPEADQFAWLEEHCSDAEVRRSVAALLERDRQNHLPQTPQPELPTAAFGPYRAVESIGRGGTSSVYRGVRTSGQFEQTVAIKVIAPFFNTPAFRKRLETERQLLASLDHPNISHLLDAGTSSAGDPYLALQYIQGERLDCYCDARKLDVRERLRLLLQITSAVEYAHKKGIVHRDLKPGNILVTAEGQVKLLDFGTGALLSTAEDSTVTRSRMVTPRYASPERLRGESANVANDVFSLGVILYELLTGSWPFGSAAAAEEWQRSTTEAAPLDPTSAVVEASAAMRSTSVTQLRRALVGDLSAIVLKALESDPRRRYSSVEQLSADISAYLEGRPISARPPTFFYKGGKFVRKHWLPVAALSCILALTAYIALRPAPTEKQMSSIAVLPFKNLGDSNEQYYVDGMTDSFREALSRNRLLLVIGKASASALENKNAKEIGNALNVNRVLTGEISKSDGRVHLVAHILRTQDGEQMWSTVFDRNLKDSDAIVSDVAAAVAGNLRAISGIPRFEHQVNPEATEWIMRARYDSQNLSPAKLALAESDCRKAIEIDPQMAAAHMCLANLISDRWATYFRDPTNEEMEETEKLTRRALALDPLIPGGHVLLGILALQFRWDWDTAEREFTLATAGPPSANPESLLAALLVQRGRFAEAQPHIERALRFDPYGAVTLNNITNTVFWTGRTKEAIQLARRYYEVAPNSIQAQMMFLEAEVWAGHANQTWPAYAKLRQKYPAVGAMFEAWSRAIVGQKEESLKLLRPLEEGQANAGLPLAGFARAYAFMGDEPNTIKWLERAADHHEWQVLAIGVAPGFKNMGDSPGMHRLKKRIGLE